MKSKNKINVLFVIDTLQIGGAERSILEITSRFKKFNPIICTLFSKSGDLRSSFIQRGIKVVELDLHGRLWLLQGIPKLKAVVQEYDPAIIHANLFKAELLTRLSIGKSRINIGSFVNDSYSTVRYNKQSSFQNFKLNFYKYIDRVTAKNVFCFTSITNAIATTNSKSLRIPSQKIVTIYRGRSIDNYEVVHPPIDKQPFVFLIVARLLVRKGYYELIEATNILKQSGARFKVLVAGEGHDRKLFEDKVNASGLNENFEFLGSRNDIPKLLQQCHCFVFPSHYEGQGGALVEAMLAGKPIVATRIDVLQEQIEEGKAGVFFELFNAKDLAEKMLWVINNYDEAKQMGLYARTIAEEKFDINQIAKQHEDLYSYLLGNNENSPVSAEASVAGR